MKNVSRKKENVERNINDVIAALPAEERRQVMKRARQIMAEYMTLQELRLSKAITQAQLAKELNVAQKQISEIENRTDMHISTVRRHIEALGGTMEIMVKLPGQKCPVALSGIGEITAR